LKSTWSLALLLAIECFAAAQYRMALDAEAAVKSRACAAPTQCELGRAALP
jgi:hypothetical protein